MNKLSLIIACLVLMVNAMIYGAGGVLPGSGTESDPYQIEDIDDFDAFSVGDYAFIYRAAGVYTKLMGELDLGGRVYDKAVAASDTSHAFKGHFDGNHYSILNMTIAGTDYCGLFGVLAGGGSISNVHLKNVDITASVNYAGAIVAYNGEDTFYEGGTVYRCTSTGTVTGRDGVGGIVGYNYVGEVIESSSSCAVTATDFAAGGLCGGNGVWDSSQHYNEAIIENSYATGTVVGGLYGGGLVGEDNGGSILNCYSTGNVSKTGSTGFIGGLVATKYGVSIIDASFWDVDTSGLSNSAGGVGKTTAYMQDIDTFQDAGWDFMSGVDDGDDKVWHMPAGSYPILDWQNVKGITIPNVVGLSQAEAETAIVGFGYAVGNVTFEFSDAVAVGELMSQYPAAGVVYRSYSEIDFVVSLGVKLGGGDGSMSNPYQICNQVDFDEVCSDSAYWESGVYIRLDTDLDLDPTLPGRKVYTKAPISGNEDISNPQYSGTAYTGSFDGNGHVIRNLSVNGISYCGLFGLVGYNGEVNNLGVENVNISAIQMFGGGLAGTSYGILSNCYTTGLVSSAETAGGLAGLNYGEIFYCYSNCSTSGLLHTGGFVGANIEYLQNGIYDCYATGPVVGANNVGGFSGYNTGDIRKCYATGSVSGSQNMGGFAGLDYGLIEASFWDVDRSGIGISGDDNYGAIGKSTDEMSDENTFVDAGWDFANVWIMGNYPVLQWQKEVVDLPNVVGMSQAAAEAALATSGISLFDVAMVYSNSVAAGDVAGQYPHGGERIANDTKVMIYVSLGDTDYLAGSGTMADPYLIQDLDDFEFYANVSSAFMYWDYDVYTKLTADIDLDGKEYNEAVIAPDTDKNRLGYQGIAYRGYFYGDGHKITNFTIVAKEKGKDYLGLFGKVGGCIPWVKNLHVEVDIDGYGDSEYCGAICGENDGFVENCSSSGMIVNCQTGGGICGNNNGSINNSRSECDLIGDKVGGVVCINNDEVAGCLYVGYIGCESGGGLCYSNVDGGVIRKSGTEVTIEGVVDVGGFCGINDGEIYRSYAKGDVMGGLNVIRAGGFVGFNHTGSVGYSYSLCNMSFTAEINSAGGFCGMNGLGGAIGQSYSAGVLDLGYYQVYAAGFCGVDISGQIANSYWDKELAGLGYSGSGGHSTYDMKQISMYLVWDFSDGDGDEADWYMPNGEYPKLAWESDKGLVPGSGMVDDPYLINDIAGFEVYANFEDLWDIDLHTKLMCDLDLKDYVTHDIQNLFRGRIGDVKIYSTDVYQVGNLTAIDPNKLEGHWSFDDIDGDVAQDSSGKGREATLMDGVTSLDNELLFNGVTNYVIVDGYGGVAGSGARTVISRIKTYEDLDKHYQTDQTIVSWGSLDAGKLWMMAIDKDTGQLSVTCFGGRIKGGPDLEDGYWHEVAAVLPDGANNINQMKLYVDGIEVSTNSSTLDCPIDTDTSKDVIIGAINLADGMYHSEAIIFSNGRSNYSGIFDGNGHVVRNVKVSGDYECGLFGYLGENAKISNLGIENVDIRGVSDAGGLAYYNGGEIYNCYTTGYVECTNASSASAGGLIGYNAGNISTCYSACEVSGNDAVGGLVGSNLGSIDTSYSVGLVSAGASIRPGGLVSNGDYSDVVDCFWDVETSGQTVSAGGMGRTTAEMKDVLTYLKYGWDMSSADGDKADWYMPMVSYPRLSWKTPDLSEDDVVNMEDFARFSINWLEDGCDEMASCYVSDFDESGIVDMDDLCRLAEYWLYDFVPDVPSSLALHYRFNETDGDIAYDSSDYGRAGSVYGAPSREIGRVDGSYYFDGINNYVEAGGYTGPGTNRDRTISGWIKADEDLSNADNSIHTIVSWGKMEPGSKWVVMLDANSGQLTLATNSAKLLGGPDLEDGQWHQIILILPQGANNINQVKMYVDGAEIATNAGSLDSVIDTAQTENVLVGAADTDPADGIQSPGLFFKGEIDEIRIYDVGLRLE